MNEDPKANGQLGQLMSNAENRLAAALETLLAGDFAGKQAKSLEQQDLRLESAGPCLATSDWIEIASGKPSRTGSESYLAHAALCSRCLALLRMSQELLDRVASSEEGSELANLASTSSQWQHRFAADLAQTPHRVRRKSWWSRFFWIGVCAAAVVLLSAVLLFHRNHPPEQLLAEAYSQNRTFDLRMPGAAYAPLTPGTHVRGALPYRETAPLVDARALIDRKLRQTPSDQHWLQLEARAATLDEHYDDAIAILDKLLASGPATESLLLDSSSAYFLRGIVAGDINDRAKALGYLRRAGEIVPVSPVILFNEAVVMEDLGEGADAADIWCRYLHLEHDALWKAEGLRRLGTLEQKLNLAKKSKCHWQS